MKKYFILWIALIFLIQACQQKLVLTGLNIGQYAHIFPEQKSKNFQVSVFISYDSLSKWIENRSDKTIFESKSDQSFVGFPMNASLVGPVKFRSNNSNHLSIQAPALFEAKPNVAGFNAGVVRGKLDLNLGLDLQIKAINKFEVGNLNYSYQWLEKPTVKVAGFGVNVGPVVDNLFKNKYNEVTSTIKSSLDELFKPANLEKMLISNAQKIPWPDHVFPTNDVGIGIQKLHASPQGLTFDLLLNTSIGFSTYPTEAKKRVRYFLNYDPKLGRDLVFSGQLDLKKLNELISKLAQDKLKNKAFEIHINGEGKTFLSANINGFKGAKSELKIDFVPVVFDQHVIGFRILHQEIKGLSFPRSLFKNQVIKRIDRLATNFKYDLMQSQELINPLLGPIVLNQANLNIDHILWNESSLYISGLLGADWKILN